MAHPELLVLQTLGGAVGHVKHEAKDDEHGGDQPRLTEVVLDHLFEEGTDDGTGYGREKQQPRQALLGRLDAAPRRRSQPGGDQLRQVPPEIGDGADEGAGVEGDVEGLVEVLEVVELVPVEQPGHEDQMAARRDREELRQALGDAQHDGVQDGNVSSRLGRRRGEHGGRR